jgi:archaeal flagellar protein FlaI
MDTSENDNEFLNELKKITSKKDSEANALDKLKDLKKDNINPNNQDLIKKEDHLKQNNLPMKEPEKELSNINFLKKNEKKEEEKFSWQNKTIISEEKPFKPYVDVNTDLEKAKEKQRSTMEFDWEKHDKIEEPTAKDFGNYSWLKKEVLPDKQKSGLKTTKEFDWEHREDIEEPSETDFTKPSPFENTLVDKSLKKKEKNNSNETIGAKWKHRLNPTPSTNEKINTGPKWKHHAEIKNTDLPIEQPKIPELKVDQPIKIKKELTDVKANILSKPKWKHDTKETTKPNAPIKTKTLNPAQVSTGPKWKHKTPTKETTNPAQSKTEKPKVTQTQHIEKTPIWKHKTEPLKIEPTTNVDKKEDPPKDNDLVKTMSKTSPETGPKWKHTTTTEKPAKETSTENESLPKTNKTASEPVTKTPPWKHKSKNLESKVDTPNKKITKPSTKPKITKKQLDVLDELKTPIDELFALLETFKVVDTAEIAGHIGLDYYELEKIAKTFEDYGIVEIKYPTSLKAKPKIYLKKKVMPTTRAVPKGEILDKYNIAVDGVPAEISIVMTKDEARPIYAIDLPAIGRYTKQFLSFIKNEIAEDMPIELDEIMDPKKSKFLKTRFFKESQKHLKKYFSKSSKEVLDVLSGVVLHEMYGLGSIEIILGDDMLEEVAINSSKTPITIYHRIHGWLKTNLYPGTEEDILNYSSQIGRKVGREITTLSPILDAHLLSGDRVNATLFPISAEGNTLTIRRFARKPWTLIDFIGKAHTMSSEMAAILWLAMQYEMNILIAGGTASGKTSTLNTLLSLVPSYHRIISIEDVREIILPVYLNWNWIPMITRSANPEGLGEVTMLDCMVSSLRMRPDRIIVGEVRRHKEAEVMMEAIETGHSIYSTIHANSAYQVLRRLAEPPLSIPIMQIELLDLVVVQFRDRKTNKRRTFEISEIEQTSTGKGLQVNTIYKWMPRTDDWEKLNKPNKLLTLLNLHTGLTEDEIYKELHAREKILDWMREKGISDLNMIGYIVKLFYIDSDQVKQYSIDKVSKEHIEEMMKETGELIE